MEGDGDRYGQMVLIALENMPTPRTLLRMVPDVSPDGAILPHQIYHRAQGFGVNRHDAYEVVMVHHCPLHDSQPDHGMGSSLLYMTPGECPPIPRSGP